MLEAAVFVTTLVALALAALVCWRSAGEQVVLTPAVVYVGFYVIFHYPLYFYVDDPKWYYPLILNIGLFAFAAGVFVAAHRTRPRHERRERLKQPIDDRATGPILVALVLLGLAVMLAYFQGLPLTFAVLVELAQGANPIDTLKQFSAYREELTKSHYFGGEYRGQGALKLANEVVWQLTVIMGFTMALVRRSWLAWLGFALVGLLGFLSIYGAGVRMPVAMAVFGMVIARTQLARFGPRDMTAYGVALLLLVVALFLTQPQRLGEAGSMITALAVAIGDRLFLGNGMNTYFLITRVVEGDIAIRWGFDHFVSFMNAMPGIEYGQPFAHKLWEMMNPELSANRKTYATYTYLGTMFLDFGIWGVVVFNFVIGAVMHLIYRWFCRLPKSVFLVALGAFATLKLGMMVVKSIVSLGPITVIMAVALIPVFIARQLGQFRVRLRRREAPPPAPPHARGARRPGNLPR